MSARSSLFIGLAMLALFTTPTTAQQTPEELLQSALYKQQVEGDLNGAVEILQTLIDDFAEHREIAASALVLLGRVHETLGSANAERAYRRVLNDYPDQRAAVAEARARLALLTPASLPETEAQGLVARQICSRGSGFPCGGKISPNGRYLAFADWPALETSGLPGELGLAVYDLETEEYRLVSNDAGGNWVQAILWSPDGQRLVYTAYEDTDNIRYDLHIVDLDGTDHSRLVDDLPVFSDQPQRGIKPFAWSAQGDFIVATLRGFDDVRTIALISVSDGSVTPVKTLPGQAEVETLSLSPDDRYIVYDYPQESGDERDLFLLALDGSRDGPIAPHVAHDSRPSWTPDGDRVVFLSDRSGRADLWAMEVVDGMAVGEPEVVRPDVGEIEIAGFLEDGALAYGRSLTDRDIHVAEIDWEGGSFKGEATRLSERFIGTNDRPAWSPDGSRIAYLSRRAGPGAQGATYLVVKSLEDGAERDIELRMGLHMSSRPQWSADGRQILMAGRYSDETSPTPVSPVRAAYRIDIETGEIEREPFLHDWAGWSASHDGWHITGRQSEGLRSLGIRLAGQRDLGAYMYEQAPLRPGERLLQLRGAIQWVRSLEPELHPQGAEFEQVGPSGLWALSPDGTTLALAVRGEVWTMPLKDIEMRRMWVPGEGFTTPSAVRVWESGEDGEQARSVRWMPDGRHLVFSARRLKGC